MTSYTPSQARAIAGFETFAAHPESTVFALLGPAGTGKSFLTARLLQQMEGGVLFCAPTHKAIGVSRRFLDSIGVAYSRKYDKRGGARVVTDTTAAALGISPVIVDDQDERVQFGRTGAGALQKMIDDWQAPAWVVIDECSMLSMKQFQAVLSVVKKYNAQQAAVTAARARGGSVLKLEKYEGARMRIVLVGDPCQLPPVKAKPIPFDKVKNKFELVENMRFVNGNQSAIYDVADAIREGRTWGDCVGGDVERVANLQSAFLEAVVPPGDVERERVVAVAYTNRTVNALQELACQKVYGHDRLSFEVGQLVIAQAPVFEGFEPMCTNQEELRVMDIREPGTGAYGLTPVTMMNSQGLEFDSLYLSEEDRANKIHPYNIALREAETDAKELQATHNANRKANKIDVGVDQRRRQAWGRFFDLRDRTVVTFVHPFAITAHKSQGSTYGEVYVVAGELNRFDKRALYVAVTRPAKRLVMG